MIGIKDGVRVMCPQSLCLYAHFVLGFVQIFCCTT